MSTRDWTARATWEGLNITQTTALWMAYVATGRLGAHCTKVGASFFYYPSLQAQIRGAIALQDIEKGERLCEVPVQSLFSEYAVGNSTLAPVIAALRTSLLSSPGENGKHEGATWRLRRRATHIDTRAILALFALRELERVRSPWMPYLQMVAMHDVSGVPMVWPETSPRWEKVGQMLHDLGARARKDAVRQYEALVEPAIEWFGASLSDGLSCGGSCPLQRLKVIYSMERFLRFYAIIAARDWVLPLNGEPKAFLAPILDMLNFGQVLHSWSDTMHHPNHLPPCTPAFVHCMCMTRF